MCGSAAVLESCQCGSWQSILMANKLVASRHRLCVSKREKVLTLLFINELVFFSLIIDWERESRVSESRSSLLSVYHPATDTHTVVLVTCIRPSDLSLSFYHFSSSAVVLVSFSFLIVCLFLLSPFYFCLSLFFWFVSFVWMPVDPFFSVFLHIPSFLFSAFVLPLPLSFYLPPSRSHYLPLINHFKNCFGAGRSRKGKGDGN